MCKLWPQVLEAAYVRKLREVEIEEENAGRIKAIKAMLFAHLKRGIRENTQHMKKVFRRGETVRRAVRLAQGAAAELEEVH